jgi:hypothetical protein
MSKNAVLIYFPSWYLEEKSCEVTAKNKFKMKQKQELSTLKGTFLFENMSTRAHTHTHMKMILKTETFT